MNGFRFTDEEHLEFLSHQGQLTDIMKQLVFGEDESLIDSLDFDDDRFFQSPALYSFFNFPGDKPRLADFLKSHWPYCSEMGNFSLVKEHWPFFRFAFEADNGVMAEDVDVASVVGQMAKPIALALKYISEKLPVLDKRIRDTVQWIVPFSSQQMNSFASLSCHGAIFINRDTGNGSLPFLLDDICHQSAHVYFNTFGLAKPQFFLVDPDTQVRDACFNGEGVDTRALYTVLHANFTYTQILEALHALATDQQQLSSHKEALARIGFYHEKFRYDLGLLTENGVDLLSEKGGEICLRMGDFLQESKLKFPTQFTYATQPYNFSLEAFKQENSLGEVSVG